MHSGARTLLTSPPFVANAAESLLFDLYIKLVKERHNRGVFGGCICLRMGYLIPTYLIENHRYLSRAILEFVVKPVLLRGWVFAGDIGERSTSHPASRQDRSWSAAAGCSPICFRGKKKKEKKKIKETDQNNAKGKHQQENSMFFVMLFLWGHLLLAIRLNHWNLPWSYICHCLHFPTSVIN